MALGWEFPSYGDGLPHDLCHLVVEEELALLDGFWGLVDQGVEVALVDGQATLVRNGRPFAEQAGGDISACARSGQRLDRCDSRDPSRRGRGARRA